MRNYLIKIDDEVVQGGVLDNKSDAFRLFHQHLIGYMECYEMCPSFDYECNIKTENGLPRATFEDGSISITLTIEIAE